VQTRRVNDVYQVSKKSSDYSHWISSFRKVYNRPPSILHIGNIANNAYNNSKLLNKVGLNSDVISYNYFHIMGCPEWEDADFEGVIKNQFFPNWRRVNLGGFKRPRWFAQGAPKPCIKYLIAKQDGSKVRAWFWWNVKGLSRNILCSGFYRLIMALRNKANALRNELTAHKTRWYPIDKVVLHFLIIIYSTVWLAFYSLLSCIVVPIRFLKTVFRRPNLYQKHDGDFEYSFDGQVSKLIEKWEQIFPDRDDKLLHLDLEHYRPMITLWRSLFSRYDIIQGYSTDPILPLLAGKPYFAFEHGTLREIPFQKNLEGRITALSYSLANHVFVTNGDCIENAHKLADNRVSFINHPFDEDHGLNIGGWEQLRRQLSDLLDADFLFFFPTRHDWVPGTGYGDKGNDLFLRAFCKLRRDGRRVGMVCCRWGANVNESVNLLEEKDCHRYVLWSEPMGTVKFERTAKACDLVVDQFKLGSFGGVMFKAMAVGVPICTYLDEYQMRQLYDEVPPVINCMTDEDIVANIIKIIEEPSILEELSVASRDWIKKNHGSLDTINTQIFHYKNHLEKDISYLSSANS
jgi:glycosyltransferase involved in cell wall biosynthesis